MYFNFIFVKMERSRKIFDYCLKCNKVDSCLMIKFFGLKEFKKRFFKE